MIKVAQFGEGNFLRAFAESYFQSLNEEGYDCGVSIVKPRPGGSLEKYHRQKNRYHVVLRGKTGEKVQEISVVDAVFSPFEEPQRFYALAQDPALKLIVSNTTEAGICFQEGDRFDDLVAMSFPGKLTRFLYARFMAGQPGVYLLPTELVDHNADLLRHCVQRYIQLWQLPEEFRVYNDTENYYCNTLVDRIVSGYPKTSEEETYLHRLVGCEDRLLCVAEPFGLWAVENKGKLEKYLPSGNHNIQMVLTEDIEYYKKRKVRILNGSHTNLAPAGLLMGKSTVFQCMEDATLKGFLHRVQQEIIPFVSADTAMTEQFAKDVEERFCNPYLNHALSGICLNSVSKWKARILPSFRDYYQAHGRIAPALTLGFSFLMMLYKTQYNILSDDPEYLSYFAEGGSVEHFMQDARVWGEDLTAYDGFASKVAEYISRMERGECLL